MNKIMLSLADETYLTVSSQAKKRGISVQELLRAVIVPETARDEEYLRLLETSTPSDNRTIVLCCDHSHDHSLRKLADPASLLTFFQEFLEHLCIKRHM